MEGNGEIDKAFVSRVNFDEIFERISVGSTIQKEAEKIGIPVYKLTGPIMKNAELARQYELAEIMRAMMWADEIVSIADESCLVDVTDREGNVVAKGVDNAKVNQLRLRIDTRKWIVQKLLPKFKEDAVAQAADALGELLTRVNKAGRGVEIVEKPALTIVPK